MSLIAIKKYLVRVKTASLLMMSVYFDAEPDLLRAQLQHWINKGYVRKMMQFSACADQCGQCAIAAAERYEWLAEN